MNEPPRRSSSEYCVALAFSATCVKRLGDVRNRHAIDVAQHGNHQAARRVDGDAQIDIVLVDDLAGFHVERSVQRRMLLERQRDGFHHEHQRRELDVRAGVVGDASFANPLQLGDVGVVEIG